MLMIIFGAGASYDSVPALPPSISNRDRPPLADQLFETRPEFTEAMARFPKCQPIIPYLQATGTPVERELERLQTEAQGYPEGLQQLAAIRYYLHSMLWDLELRWNKVAQGVTNYKTLLDQIQRWQSHREPVCLATFNYDTMLESALPSVGIKINTFGDYVGSERHFRLIKLHGSVNWAREIYDLPFPIPDNNLAANNKIIDSIADLQISNHYRIVTSSPMGKARGALYPALAIPFETKRSFECPEIHLSILRQCVKQVNKLLIIGWRGMEDHFLTLLHDHLSSRISVMVVSGSADEAKHTFLRIAKAGIEFDPFPPEPLNV